MVPLLLVLGLVLVGAGGALRFRLNRRVADEVGRERERIRASIAADPALRRVERMAWLLHGLGLALILVGLFIEY